jgi:hypothetical protein
MGEKALAEKLVKEVFLHTYVWQDEAGANYPGHTYARETAHIVLVGVMMLTMNGSRRRITLVSDATCRRARFIRRKWGRTDADILSGKRG